MKPHKTEGEPHPPAALVHFDELPDAAHVRAPIVAALRDISQVTVWRWVKAGKLPAPVRVGNTTTWRVGDLRRSFATEVKP